jgi:hypothetical protein
MLLCSELLKLLTAEFLKLLVAVVVVPAVAPIMAVRQGTVRVLTPKLQKRPRVGEKSRVVGNIVVRDSLLMIRAGVG